MHLACELEDSCLVLRELEEVANGRYCTVLVEFSAGVQDRRQKSRLDPGRNVDTRIDQRYEGIIALIEILTLATRLVNDRISISSQPQLTGDVPEIVPQNTFRHVALEVTLNEQALAEDIRRDIRQSSSVHALCPCDTLQLRWPRTACGRGGQVIPST